MHAKPLPRTAQTASMSAGTAGGAMYKQVFISYSTKDKAQADAILGAL
jgi:hypothetical protein